MVEYGLILAVLWACTAFVLRFLPNAGLSLPAAGAASVFLICAYCRPEKMRSAAEICFRYRWAIALAVFLLCVCLRLHGSSIGIYNEVFPTQIRMEETTLFGVPRWIRSDEFGVATPTYLSQAANSYRLYSRQMSLSPTNMVLNYYSPVWDWTILGKPLSWGFLLFGGEIGLSWYWCGEIILLFMTALEMCLILTKGMRLESLTGAAMIALSPAVQWWVMPHMPPVILYAMALFCAGYWFFTAESACGKWISAALSCIAAVGFALSIFPSFQVPCAYTSATLLVVCLWRDRNSITFDRNQWVRLVFPAAVTAGIIGRFLLISGDDLSILLNTVYPGRRMALGGGFPVSALFTDLTSFFLPYQDVPFLNNCEAATYIHFAPFFLLLSPKLFVALRNKGDDNLKTGIALTALLAVMILYMLAGIPRKVSEITLLRFCNRMHEVYGWAAVLFTVWGFSALAKHPGLLGRTGKILFLMIYAAVNLLIVDRQRWKYFERFAVRQVSLGTLLIVLTLTGIVCVLAFALCRHRKQMSALLILMMLFCGATVNPIERGLGALTNHPISAAISEIAALEPEGSWLCLDSVFFLSNYPMSHGARVLDATNFYPDGGKWRIFDPQGEYEEFTNRYANESAELTLEQTRVELLNPDHIHLYLNPDSLKDLNSRYLRTPVDHTELLSAYGIHCERVAGQDGYNIYRIGSMNISRTPRIPEDDE